MGTIAASIWLLRSSEVKIDHKFNKGKHYVAIFFSFFHYLFSNSTQDQNIVILQTTATSRPLGKQVIYIRKTFSYRKSRKLQQQNTIFSYNGIYITSPFRWYMISDGIRVYLFSFFMGLLLQPRKKHWVILTKRIGCQ